MKAIYLNETTRAKLEPIFLDKRNWNKKIEIDGVIYQYCSALNRLSVIKKQDGRENAIICGLYELITGKLFSIQSEKDITIKEMRVATGMTQKAFSEYFNIPKRSIENWESGVSQPPDYLIDLVHYKLAKEGLIKNEEQN